MAQAMSSDSNTIARYDFWHGQRPADKINWVALLQGDCNKTLQGSITVQYERFAGDLNILA